MNILFIGNSLSRGFYENYLLEPSIFGENINPYFLICPGDMFFQVVDDKLIYVDKDAQEQLTFKFPQNVMDLPLSHFNKIIIGAVGLISDHTFKMLNYSNEFIIFEFGPKINSITNIPINKTLYKKIIKKILSFQKGIIFLDNFKKIKHSNKL